MRVLWLSIFIAAAASAQDKHAELKVGERFPDYEFRNVINYSRPTFNVGDYRGKLVILDLWATTCSSCVNAWPKVLELQEKFKGKMVFLLVNKFEKEDVVRQFLLKRRKLTGIDMNLPNSCGDPNVRLMFPQSGVPRYIWIGADGIVGSATYGSELTEANIEKWLKEGPQQLPQVIDNWIRPDVAKPLFVDGNGGFERSSDFIWNSVLTKGSINIPGATDISATPQRGYFVTVTGASVELLYRIAFNEKNLDEDFFESFLPNGRIDFPDGADSLANTLYNYQLISGRRLSRGQLLEYMKLDLERFFGYSAEWQTVARRCLVWKMTDSSKVSYKGGIRDVYMNDTEVIYDSVTVKHAIRFMEDASRYFYSPYPIIDDTNYKGLLGLHFECNCSDPVELDKAFKKHGMRLIIEDRPVPVLTIRKRSNDTDD